jgi:hypothetical protein
MHRKNCCIEKATYFSENTNVGGNLLDCLNMTLRMRRLTYLTLYIILLGVVFFGLSDKIIYHNNQDLVSWLPFILLFPVQALLVYCLAKAFGATNLYAKGIVGLAILITGPAFGFYIKNKQQKELSKNGSQTIGVVFKKWK